MQAATPSIRVLVPIKSFALAKARLSGVLSPEGRDGLARFTAGRVLAAAAPNPVHVVCDDRVVAEWAESHGASVIWSPGTGLDGAVRGGVEHLGELGATHVVVAHGDLARASSFGHLVVPHAVTLVPDLRGDGTNVAAVPVDARFPFAYGSRSFERHQRLAIDLGLPMLVCRDPMLALDIDTPDDLTHPLVQEVLPSWLRTNQDSPTRVAAPRH